MNMEQKERKYQHKIEGTIADLHSEKVGYWMLDTLHWRLHEPV